MYQLSCNDKTPDKVTQRREGVAAEVHFFFSFFLFKSSTARTPKSSRMPLIFSGSSQQPPLGSPYGSCRQLRFCNRRDSCVCRSNGEFRRKDFHSGSQNLEGRRTNSLICDMKDGGRIVWSSGCNPLQMLGCI